MLNGWELLNKAEQEIIAKGIMEGKVYGGPYHLTLFPTDRCNLNCFFCYTTSLRNIGDELEWDVLKRTLEEGAAMGIKGVSFGGGGESFIYKHFSDILDFIETHFLTIDIIKTNGTALTSEIARRLLQYKLKRITISLNETTPEAYSKMSQCSPRLFEKAMEGIKNIISAKKETNSDCEIIAQVFVWRENYWRLRTMISEIAETGADFIYINTIDELSPELKLNNEEKEELKNIIREIMKEWAHKLQCNFAAEELQDFVKSEQHKICPSAIELPDICKTPNRIEYCNIGWYSPVIGASGDVYPCCHFSNDKNKSLGNLYNQSLREIWYGEKAQHYRKEMLHLLLTNANIKLLPRKMRFISPLCLERAACAFNFYLCSPDFYFRIHKWAENGPRTKYTTLQQLKSASYNVLRTGKRIVKKLLGL